MSVLRIYQRLLKNHFMVVQAAQTGLLMGTGDIIAQTLIEGRTLKTYQPKRSIKFTLLGTIFVGPTLTVWYRLLARKFGNEMSTSTTLKKVLSDQLLFAPTFIAVFLTTVNLIEGVPIGQIKRDLPTNYPDIVVANWKLWPAVQLVNFYFVPLRHQVVLVQGVALIWNTYLSWKTHQFVNSGFSLAWYFEMDY